MPNDPESAHPTKRVQNGREGSLSIAPADATRHRVVPAALATCAEDVESASVWGFRDTAFGINARGHVELSGNRYALSGNELPLLMPWTRETLAVDLATLIRFSAALLGLDAERAERTPQKIASGLSGDPVPPSTGSGANVIRNS